MLTYQDCLGLCDLTEEEIEAVALHEHIPQIVAVELGNYLLHRPDGTLCIKRMILDDIDQAQHGGDNQRVFQLKLVLKHFVDTHPERMTEKMSITGEE